MLAYKYTCYRGEGVDPDNTTAKKPSILPILLLSNRPIAIRPKFRPYSIIKQIKSGHTKLELVEIP
jgi:hypothetical protein